MKRLLLPLLLILVVLTGCFGDDEEDVDNRAVYTPEEITDLLQGKWILDKWVVETQDMNRRVKHSETTNPKITLTFSGDTCTEARYSGQGELISSLTQPTYLLKMGGEYHIVIDRRNYVIEALSTKEARFRYKNNIIFHVNWEDVYYEYIQHYTKEQ